MSEGNDVLVVVSKLKKYVRSVSGMNTSGSVAAVLSDFVRRRCEGAIERAKADGRKTLMDRDFTEFPANRANTKTFVTLILSSLSCHFPSQKCFNFSSFLTFLSKRIYTFPNLLMEYILTIASFSFLCLLLFLANPFSSQG